MGHIYSEYRFESKRLSKAERKAFYVMYLYKSWQEAPKLTLEDNYQSGVHQAPRSGLNEISLLKSINMNDLTLQVKELSEKLAQMSKLSYLGTLKSLEISFLIAKTRQFTSTLERFYTLKKNEEDEQLKTNEQNNNNQNQINQNDNDNNVQ